MTPRLAKVLLGFLAVATTAWLATAGGSLKAACNSPNCANDKCYAHNRYCFNSGGVPIGRRWAIAVVVQVSGQYWCTNKTLSGGTPAAKDLVAYKDYNSCDKDCATDTPTTGSPGTMMEIGNGSETLNTECKSQ